MKVGTDFHWEWVGAFRPLPRLLCLRIPLRARPLIFLDLRADAGEFRFDISHRSIPLVDGACRPFLLRLGDYCGNEKLNTG